MTPVALGIVLAAIGALILSPRFFRTGNGAFFAPAAPITAVGAKSPALVNFVQLFRDKPRRVLNVLLLGDGLVKVPLVVLCLFLLWRGPLAGHLPQWVAAILIFAIVVLLCDLVPKLIALAAPYRLSTVGAFVLQASVGLLDRVGRILESVSTAIVDLLTPQRLRTRARLSDEELETLVEIGEEEGTLHQAEGDMIQEIIKMGDKTAKDCMTPRVETFALADGLTNEQAIAQLKEKRYRRVPVYADTPDNIVGIIDVKLFLLRFVRTLHRVLAGPVVRAGDDARARSAQTFPDPSAIARIVVDDLAAPKELSPCPTSLRKFSVARRRPAERSIFTLSRLKMESFWSAVTRASTICMSISALNWKRTNRHHRRLVFNRLGYLPQAGAKIELPRLAVTVRRTSRKRIEELLLEKTTCLEDQPDANTAAA